MTPRRTPNRPSANPAQPVPLYLGLAGVIVVAVTLGWCLRGTRTETERPIASVVGPVGAPEPAGLVLTESALFGDVRIELIRAFRSTKYKLAESPEGSQFVVVVFRPLRATDVSVVPLLDSVVLRSASGDHRLTGQSIPFAETVQAEGSLTFTVPKDESEFTLVVSPKQSIALKLPTI